MNPFDFDLARGRLRIGYRSPGLTRDLDPDGKMALCRDLGMAVIEPQINAREVATPAGAEAFRKAADRAGIAIPSIGATLPLLTVPDAGAPLAKAIDFTIDCVKAAGIPYVFTMASHPPEGVPQPRAWQAAVDNIRRLADRCEAEGLRLALEPEWFLQSVGRMRHMLRDVGRKALLVNFDPTNFYKGGSDPMDIFTDFDERIVSGHIKDAVSRAGTREEAPVGEGEMDYPAILGALITRGKPINLFVEHCRNAEQVRAAAAHLSGVIHALL